MSARAGVVLVAAGGWLAAAVLAMTLCVWAVGPGDARASVQGTSALDEDDGAQRRVRVGDVHSMDDLARELGNVLNRPVYVHEKQIPWAMSLYIDIRLPEVDVRTAFRLLNAQSPDQYTRASWCVFGDHVEIGDWSKMQELQRVRRVYEVGGLANAMASALADDGGRPSRETMVRRILDTLQASVESSSWQDNGGELASEKELGTSLVIDAPLPMQREIAAVLAETRKAAWSAALANGAFGRLPSAGFGGGQSPGCFGR